MNYCTALPVADIPEARRIIVIGDLHGDMCALKAALSAASLTNAAGTVWTGGDAHLVQVGDIIDRKARDERNKSDERSERKIVKLLMSLRDKAQRAGGDVHVLLGNHEIMNVEGDFRYVSPLGFSDFGGLQGRKSHFRPGGKAASYMACNMTSVLKIGSWLFSHAGVTPHISKTYTIDQLNGLVRDYLLGNRELGSDLKDFFWHRDFASEASCSLVRTGLAQWHAKNMAIGHTVQGGINSICGASLWRVDVGLSRAFGERDTLEVLEILEDSKVNVIKGSKRCPIERS